MRNEIIVLVDYKTNDDRIEGIAMDMGNDIPLIAHQISIMERGSTPEKKFHKAYVMAIHDRQPSNFYVPDNLFGKQACGLDGSAQLPMGKRWFTLIMCMEPGLLEEE